LETVAATKIEGNGLPPLSGHVSSDGWARRGSHKALTASNAKAVSAPAARSNGIYKLPVAPKTEQEAQEQ